MEETPYNEKITLVHHQRSRNSDSCCSNASTRVNLLRGHSESVTNESESQLQNILTFIDFSSQHILESVLQEIYENLLVHLSEESRKNVVLEIWRLVPVDVRKTYCLCHAVWSPEECISAFKDAELRYVGNSERALQKLVAMKNVPFISDFVNNHINTEFKGKVNWTNGDRIHESFSSCSLLHGGSIGCTCSILNETDTYRKETTAISNNQAANKLIHKFIIHRKPILLFLLATVAVGCLGLYGISFILKYANKSPGPAVTLPYILSESKMKLVLQSTTSPKAENKLVKKKYTISVQTYADYQNAMFKFPFNSEISLTLSLQNAADWPRNAALGNAHMITNLRLEGTLNVSTLLSILKGMNNIKTLTVANTSQLACETDYNMKQLEREYKLELKHVNELRFENVKECPDFYKVISKSVGMKTVRKFVLKSGIVNEFNVKFIQKLLRNSRNSIKTIEFPETIFFTKLFDDQLGTLTNLQNLQVDFFQETDDSIMYFDKFVDEYLPNLKKIESYEGFLKWSQFLNLEKCKKLDSITIGLYIPKEVKKIDFVQLHDLFPSVRNVDLSFYFENDFVCSVVGAPDVDIYFATLVFRDNCINDL